MLLFIEVGFAVAELDDEEELLEEPPAPPVALALTSPVVMLIFVDGVATNGDTEDGVITELLICPELFPIKKENSGRLISGTSGNFGILKQIGGRG